MKWKSLILVAALMLGGCATFDPGGKSVLIGGGSFTAPVTQPVTLQDMLAIESAYQAGLLAVVNYRRFCYSSNNLGSLPSFCQNRRKIMMVAQSGVGKARIVMRSLRTFVATNDTVNAILAFNSAKQLISDLSSTIANSQVAQK